MKDTADDLDALVAQQKEKLLAAGVAPELIRGLDELERQARLVRDEFDERGD